MTDQDAAMVMDDMDMAGEAEMPFDGELGSMPGEDSDMMERMEIEAMPGEDSEIPEREEMGGMPGEDMMESLTEVGAMPGENTTFSGEGKTMELPGTWSIILKQDP